eukprot:15443813-Heterocapsa_arctica.AAC.1
MLSNRNRNPLQSSVRPENVGGVATPRRSTSRRLDQRFGPVLDHRLHSVDLHAANSCRNTPSD